MNTVTHDFPDEQPTRPTAHISARDLVLTARIRRLAELAIERLEVAPDPDAITEALGDLARIRDLCAEVCR